MKGHRSAKQKAHAPTTELGRAAKLSTVSDLKLPAPTICRFGIKLPDWVWVLPGDKPNTKSSNLAYGIFVAVSTAPRRFDLITGSRPSGLLGLEIVFAYLDQASGSIPDGEIGRLGDQLNELMGEIVGKDMPEAGPVAVFNEPERGFVTVNARFAADNDSDRQRWIHRCISDDLPFTPVQIDVPMGEGPPQLHIADASPQIAKTPDETRATYLDALLKTVPKDAEYEQKAQQYEALKHAFTQKLAASQGADIKAEMLRRGNDAHTYDAKLSIIRWANGEVRRFGLAFSNPEVGLGNLTASKALVEGRVSLIGKAKDDNDKIPFIHAKNISEIVEQIAVVEAPPRRESLAERVEREAVTSSRKPRRR